MGVIAAGVWLDGCYCGQCSLTLLCVLHHVYEDLLGSVVFLHHVYEGYSTILMHYVIMFMSSSLIFMRYSLVVREYSFVLH